ncbi:hypothetical protein LCGC14_1400240 [marine sediment metagenome]|uniref:Replication-associated protein ORF2/G2P domain-containing protein n=1 Tax=marine sediment metagenome TaxID=412755 RepID=A0A0F9MYW2_9ZZZZ
MYQPPCKCWGCSTCARLNMYQWAARIGQGYSVYMLAGITGWSFVTITSHPKLKNRDTTLWVWPKAWAKLSARMRRNFVGIRYVLIPELHGDGRLHIHMIASGGMTTGWLKANAPYCGLGYMNEAETLTDAKKAIFYVTKYLSKGLDIKSWPRSFRRIRTSQKWPPLEIVTPDVSDIEDWIYVSTYPAEGLDYLADGLSERWQVAVKAIS